MTERPEQVLKQLLKSLFGDPRMLKLDQDSNRVTEHRTIWRTRGQYGNYCLVKTNDRMCVMAQLVPGHNALRTFVTAIFPKLLSMMSFRKT